MIVNLVAKNKEGDIAEIMEFELCTIKQGNLNMTATSCILFLLERYDSFEIHKKQE